MPKLIDDYCMWNREKRGQFKIIRFVIIGVKSEDSEIHFVVNITFIYYIRISTRINKFLCHVIQKELTIVCVYDMWTNSSVTNMFMIILETDRRI